MTRTPSLTALSPPSQREGEGDVACATPAAPAHEVLLALRGIRAEYEEKVILDVPDLVLYRGEVLVVVGPNGAGKSTLLRVMGLLEAPAAGQLFYDSAPLLRSNELSYRRRLAAVFQEPLLLHGSVADNVATGLRLRGVPRREIRPRVERWLQRLGIAALEKRSVHTLSGGEAQRVSLARALVVEPKLVLLDEPFASLDAPTRATLTAEIHDLLAETNTTAVWVTHERDEALTLGHRMVVLLGGQLCQVGTPTRVFGQPANTQVAAFLGVETVLRGHVTAADRGTVTVALNGTTPPVTVAVAGAWPVGSQVFACLRPEDVTLLASPTAHADQEFPRLPLAGLSARNTWPGKVRTVESRGLLVRVAVDCGFPVIALVTRAAVEELDLVPGREVVATAKATAIHLVTAA
ncbi:MAG: molybdenum ABC transporter ATP-binding protein [Dehalococcoidia bacterium]|nr:molybdenum ABC transporter ATP-binding protein [Dehalococcoidia bacterium]